jgi:rubrerythrin
MDFAAANAALADAETLDIATMELLIRIENSGEDFYNAIADGLGNEDAAVLLRRNGREEVGHANRIRRALAIKAGPDYEPGADIDERFPVELPPVIKPSMLPYVLQAELQGDVGYQSWADHETDPEVARLLRLNGREETKHAERVREVMAILGVEERPPKG